MKSTIELGTYFGGAVVTGTYMFTVPTADGYIAFNDYDKALAYVIDTMTADGDTVLYRIERWGVNGGKKAQVFRAVKFLRTMPDGTGKVVSKNIRIDGLTLEAVRKEQRKAGIRVMR